MKKVSVVVPTYNEEDNVIPLSKAIQECFQNELPSYEFDIIYIDNKSKDGTRQKLEQLCEHNKHIKAIFNLKNFGQFNSPYHGLCAADSDCAILLCADFQDPIELIPSFVREWEKGATVVCGIKTSSKENGFIYFLRSLYYKAVKKMSDITQIKHFTGFGLYDNSFLEILRQLRDPIPFLRGLVAEYAPDHAEIQYQQQKRRAGKTKNNWYTLYDAAMLSFTSYTKIGLRVATILGFVIAILSFLVALVYLVLKLIYWDRFLAGTVPMLIGVFFMGALQLFFIGFLGEYIMNINTRVIDRPLVIEEKRFNFEKKEDVN